MRGHQLIPFKPSWSDDPAPVVSDAELEHWAEVYRARQLHKYGIRLETFLQYPEAISTALDEREYRPLLKWQRHVQADVDRAERQRRDAALGVAFAAVLQGPQGPTDAELEALITEAERGLEDYPRRGGTVVEPLHHHSWHHNGRRSERRNRA